MDQAEKRDKPSKPSVIEAAPVLSPRKGDQRSAAEHQRLAETALDEVTDHVLDAKMNLLCTVRALGGHHHAVISEIA